LPSAQQNQTLLAIGYTLTKMAVIQTIAPIFLIIVFGYIIRRNGLLKDQFVSEANRFVFLIPLPIMIFTGIVKSNIRDVSLSHILSVVVPTVTMLGISLLLGAAFGLRRGRLGTFVQTTFHGNVSYIGLAVLFYMLGEAGLKKGSILIGILILVNNTLAIAMLSWTSRQHKDVSKALFSIIKTPVIIATFLGILFLYLQIPIHEVLLRSMGILANIALPMALIIIGASMTVNAVRNSFKLSAAIALCKLVALPCLSLLMCTTLSIPYRDGLPGIILLATPTATTSYILAHQLDGDKELASSAVTLSTLISPITYFIWASI
jgi:malate permease and related proteins